MSSRKCITDHDSIYNHFNFSENKCWGDWLNSDSPTSGDGDEESRPGSCPKPSLYDCQDVEGRSMNDLELNLTVPCMEDGIKCLNSEQRTGRSCPDFKVRFVCPCPGMCLNLLDNTI